MSFLLSELVLPPPKGWRELSDAGVVEGRAFQSTDGGLRIIASIDTEKVGRRWLHVSMSRRSRVPTYDDVATVKRAFIGDDRPAYQIFPVRSEHVNIHEYCLHLWAPLGEDPLKELAGLEVTS